ncbi:MAG: F0F1 ATP synthase subunit C [Alphaproteobacteria bacterium]|nr:F0F1 ATP synthase subunit C [Alphaproteobacteria bacterium]MBQ3117004.1 F0F1 ATP synthase subunit C [Alphaproteobacteria bacterium]MBQ6853956.1 F0F1 ATP synthase subunit C [Alphaproteobacteria bacterium]MBQ8557592.1 F0F1 ATP synthase subunit C [Alphaproteobacteria bacterium]MBR3913149.1 F0F1 ATP synthase subunit C [Alphaproteobacteria bacterium]
METETMNYIAEAAKYLSLGLISLVMLAVAKGVSTVFTTIITCISRNPNVKQDVSVFAWGGAAMTEAIALYALGLAIMVLFQ